MRALPRRRLPEVARALREHLIDLGARRGGHFGGSLGTVELAVAIHAVFDTPRDRVIWDVGHQAYGHKALTGRRDALDKVKHRDGPSGFLRRVESPYDVFGAGHAGTSVSAGLGVAEGLRRTGRKNRSVVVIGDGAATAGMAFEALNHAGHIGSDVCVILNDNGMSIAPNVGGLNRSGDYRAYAEALGWSYSGPVDGHDLDALLPALERTRDAAGPRLLHVRTVKGRGFEPAEHDPFRWHATTPFDPATGQRAGGASKRSWTAAFADALAERADRDPSLVAITAAMPDGTGLDRFAERHADRVYDVGIAEQHAVTFAAGLAAEGLRPVCAIYSTFLQRAFDQIVHDVALQDLPVVFALDRAGLVGADGPTHHGVFDLAYLRLIPGLVVAAPRDENELRNLLATALENRRPFALRFPRGPVPEGACDPDPKPVALGSSVRLRDGNDVALVGIGKTVNEVLAAADALAARGIQARVLDARFVKPLDVDALVDAAATCRRIVTVEDNGLHGGFGSAVLEALAERCPGAPVLTLGLPDRFVDHGDVNLQWREAEIDAESIASRTERWLERLEEGT
ncbi:MAG: 1-deoxy-D-xylulose-5-phosphate synthase [Proteobacteria bacterium]|nr:1-deoxy-D-xylulose-5-phosphate synthase [Pseudomonadota bacterium]